MRYIWIIDALYYDYNGKFAGTEISAGAYQSYIEAKEELKSMVDDIINNRGISPIYDVQDFGAEMRFDLYYAGAARKYATMRVRRLNLI